MIAPTIAILGTMTLGAVSPEPLQARVTELFAEYCTDCHSEGEDLDLEVPPSELLGRASDETGNPLIVPGDPAASYLYVKVAGGPSLEGDPMPPDDPLTPEQIAVLKEWIVSLAAQEKDTAEGSSPPAPAATAPAPAPAPSTQARSSTSTVPPDPTHTAPTPSPATTSHRRPRPSFSGTSVVTLPSTTPLGERTLQFRIDHRFGRLGSARGALGLDLGAIMSLGIAYGILDGWDVQLRRTNSRKDWELGTKVVPIRQEDGWPLSAGAYGSMEYLNDFDGAVANRWAGSLVGLASRLWADRVATQASVGYHWRTNHEPVVRVDLGDGVVRVNDLRDTLTVGFGSTLFFDSRRRWGLDLEYFLPIPDGTDPNYFYYRGGDADLEGTSIGAWALGGSYRTARHVFQVFFTNNREIHTNLAAPGGQTDNPFPDDGPDFFLGFNLARTFGL